MSTRNWRTPAVILLCGGMTLTIALGVRHNFGLYLQPMTADLGWARQTFAFALAAQNLIYGIAQPFAGMLADPACLAWFKPAMLSEETEFPNAFLGVNKDEHLDRWKGMPAAGKSALRWRSAVRLSAELRRTLPEEQLLTLRYEDMLQDPSAHLDRVLMFCELSAERHHLQAAASIVRSDRAKHFSADPDLRELWLAVKDSKWMKRYGYDAVPELAEIQAPTAVSMSAGASATQAK